MNFERLRTFLIAAEELNFTQAARRLSLSQPAISQQIKEIEEDLGVSLFDRRGRTILLTPAGEKLRPLADALLKKVLSVREELEEFRGVPQGSLQIGAGNAVGIYQLPRVLGHFAQHYPGIRISLQLGDTVAILRGLRDGNLDLAVVEEEPSSEQIQGLTKTPYIEDELVLIAHPDHEWAGRGAIALEELGKAWFVVRKPNCPINVLIKNHLAEAGFDPNRLNIRFEFGNTEGIKRTVMAGLGVGFASSFSVLKEINAKYLVKVNVEGLKIDRTIWLVHPSQMAEGGHQQAFCEELLSGKWLLPNLALKSPE
ncbi:MAG TPA: LysR substrate-binding domain-containing protein [Chroococcales cyanobacterium]